MTLRLGIKNLFHRDPPFANQGLTFSGNFDATVFDPRGRTYYGSVNYSF